MIKQCFLTYEMTYRQQINPLKSSISFSSNTMGMPVLKSVIPLV